MTGTPRGRYALTAVLSICVAALGVGMCSVAVGSLRPTAPPQDSFTGRITFATGKFTGARGQVTILLKTDRFCGLCRVPSRRQLKVVLDGRRCGTVRRCIRLTGTMTGTLLAQPTISDVGVPFAIVAHGMIRPLGHVSATGSVHGAGFIRYAYQPLHLTLSAPGGRLAIDAKSGRVPGFTSP